MQLAKLAGNKVVATCGGASKAKLLKDLGVDRVIDYKSEDIKTVHLLNPLVNFVFSSILLTTSAFNVCLMIYNNL